MVVFGLVGAGGFAREVLPLVRNYCERQSIDTIYILETEPSSASLNGIEIISVDAFNSIESDQKFFTIAFADGRNRQKISRDLIQNGGCPISIKHENAVVMDNVVISEGAILSPFTCLTSDIKIGRFFHANIYSYVAHDCIIGDYVTFAPKVCCNGNVHIDDYAYIGTGAVLKQGKKDRPLKIGKGAIVGMGAVVTKDVAPGEIVIGNPAKPMKNVNK